MRPGCSAGESRGPVPVPLSKDAAVVGTGKRGEIMSGAPKGVAGDLSGVPKPGMAGDNSRCVSAAADASLLHSSSHANHNKKIKMNDAITRIKVERYRARTCDRCHFGVAIPIRSVNYGKFHQLPFLQFVFPVCRD